MCDLYFVSVGGGGLLHGVQLGLLRLQQKNLWLDVRIVAVETHGSGSFHLAKKTGSGVVPVALSKIDTVATSLGALQVILGVLLCAHANNVCMFVVR